MSRLAEESEVRVEGRLYVVSSLSMISLDDLDTPMGHLYPIIGSLITLCAHKRELSFACMFES